jgi:hypothetical protein
MAQILQSLNDEWATLASSVRARRALRRWSAAYVVLGEASDLDDVLELGFDPDAGPVVRRALAELSGADELAARTLMQALLGGLCNLARRVGRDDDAMDDIVRLAWERIRTYPVHRPGTVSGNVLLDVRKWYRQEQESGERERRAQHSVDIGPSAEDMALAAAAYEDLLASVGRSGVPGDVVGTIIRSRVAGESMADLAAEQAVSVKVLWHRRWRAEARLRQLPLAS